MDESFDTTVDGRVEAQAYEAITSKTVDITRHVKQTSLSYSEFLIQACLLIQIQMV